MRANVVDEAHATRAQLTERRQLDAGNVGDHGLRETRQFSSNNVGRDIRGNRNDHEHRVVVDTGGTARTQVSGQSHRRRGDVVENDINAQRPKS